MYTPSGGRANWRREIWLKSEDLNQPARATSTTVGRAHCKMGKPRVIAETGAGQHGVATATIAARYGMECVVYMGSEDVKRQAQNVYRMNLLGATVVPVESGSKTLKDALNEAMRDWVTNVENTFYIIGTVAGPHPYPMMVRDFQRVIGDECVLQMPEYAGRHPDAVIACVGGGSNARAIFYPYISIPGVRLIGWKPARGTRYRRHAASLTGGRPGVLHGNRTYLLQDANGRSSRRIPCRRPRLSGVGPEHAWLKDVKRGIRRDRRRGSAEGISRVLPHRGHHSRARVVARARVCEESRADARQDNILPHQSPGRGDKDMATVAERDARKRS